jgi:hypothetical protein
MVVDASVVVSRLVPHDIHHEASRRWLARHVASGGLVIAPPCCCPRSPAPSGAVPVSRDWHGAP